MQGFPIFLSLAGRDCLVVGGGRVGVAKARRLAHAGAQVLVVDPSATSMLLELVSTTAEIELAERCFEEEDCAGRLLVFCCTDDPVVNESAALAARRSGALTCRSDNGEAGDFLTGATFDRGPLTVAVSSGGASPRLARQVRDRLSEALGAEYGEAASRLAALREQLRTMALDHETFSNALAAVAVDTFVDLIRSGDHDAAQALLGSALESARTQSGQKEARWNR